MARKRKTLPKDFESMLETAALNELIAVFDRCELDARGSYNKQTALGFAQIPDDLARWLVDQGLDPDTPDSNGRTPLASRAVAWLVPARQIPLFLELGADIEAQSKYGETPLQLAVKNWGDFAARTLIEHGAVTSGDGWNPTTMLDGMLSRTENNRLEQAVELSTLLFEHGAELTQPMRQSVERIGEHFEEYRSVFAADQLEAADTAITALYRMFDIAPVLPRIFHDGTSPITLPEGTWGAQHSALWDSLVPGNGPAPTQQGEVIRITGKISDEMFRNGGANWDEQHRALVDAAVLIMKSGTSLPESSLDEFSAAVADVRPGRGSERALQTLTRLSVEWVGLNPTPVPLEDVDYTR